MINKDISLLEKLLSNVSMAKLEKEDLKIMRDKNVIKLFKLGQLANEYLLYHLKYTNGITEQIQARYTHQFEKTKRIEDEVKNN